MRGRWRLGEPQAVARTKVPKVQTSEPQWSPCPLHWLSPFPVDPGPEATKGIEDGSRGPRDSEVRMVSQPTPALFPFAALPLL
jgi:hypothetical protein